MANLKKGTWSPKETAQIQGLPKDSKLSAKLAKIASKLGRSYPTVYQKWYFEYVKGQDTPDTTNIPAMDLEFDPNYEGKATSVDPIEQAAFEKGLEKTLPLLKPFKGGISVPKRLEKVAKEYVQKYYPSHVYSMHVINGNNKAKRLMRKV